jgi:uncharacterized protein YjiS (DUF1127 family)
MCGAKEYFASSTGTKKGRRSFVSFARTLSRTLGVSVMSIRVLASKLHEWRRYRLCLRELAQLSDRELSDIGLSRSDIPFVASKAARS